MALPNKVITEKIISDEKSSLKGLESISLTTIDDINLLLKKIFNHHSLLTISFEESDIYYGSTIIEINRDENYLVIDELYPEEGHQLIEVGKKIKITTQYCGALVYFSTTIEAIGSNDKAAYYKINIPESLEYHQRRSTYRVSTSISSPIPVNLVNKDEVLISAELRDISLGGVSLRVSPPQHITIEEGDYIPTCLIQVSDEKKILSSLDICHVIELKESGSLRVGAKFAEISKIDQREVEQLIATLDRAIIKKIKRADTRITI